MVCTAKLRYVLHVHAYVQYTFTYSMRQKQVSGLSQYLPVLPQYLEGISEGTSVGTYCTVRLKHITHAKKFSREVSSCTYTTHQRFCRQMPLLSSCHIGSFILPRNKLQPCFTSLTETSLHEPLTDH